MKDVIILEKTREKERQLVVRNAIKQAKVAKMSNSINFDSKYMQVINNIDIDAAKDLGLTGVKKYLKRTSQIKVKVNWLYRNQILVLAIFIKHFRKMYDNEKMT